MNLLDRLRRKETPDAELYKEVAKYFIGNVALNSEQADIISQKLGVHDRYAELLQESEQNSPYRNAYDLGSLLSQAWHEKESKALVRREESSLERKVESAELAPVEESESSSLALGYAKVFGKAGLAIAKWTYIGIKELTISSLSGLLPGFLLKRVSKKGVEKGGRRILNNLFSIGYDAAFASTVSYLIASQYPTDATFVGVLAGVFACIPSLISKTAYIREGPWGGPYEKSGALGPLFVEIPLSLPRLVYYGAKALHAAAKEEAEKKKKPEQVRLQQSTTPASPRMLVSVSDKEE